MIRINLLPIKKQRAAASGRNLIFVAIAALAVELVGIGILHASATSEVDDIVRGNQEISARIDRIKDEISDHDRIRAELDQINARDQIITKLQAARTGPVFALMELARIVSNEGPNVDPTVLAQMRIDNPLTAPNLRWDSRRLWLTEVTEGDRAVKIKGQARGHDDVAELIRRLAVSSYFESEQLIRTQVIQNSELHMDLVEFEIHCTARYH
ncbi:MAG: PilN domain-containing protein [Deltaproteobacteria bacterium]|nr:PilN domain-containing protein [Deltaproteobacteria bacterium]